MTLRRPLRVAAALLLLVIAAACAPSSSSTSSKSVKLTLWSWRPEDTAAYTKILAQFHSEHPNITVEYKPYKNTEYNTILQTGLTKAGGPDVAMLRSYGLLQPLVAAHDLVPLDGKVDVSGFANAVLNSARGKADRKLYGVPAAVQTLQVFYNKKIFAANGITPPRTWQDMVAAAQKLKGRGVTPIATTGKDTWMLPIVSDIFGSTRYGGAQFEQRVLSGRAKLTDSDYVAALGLVKQIQPYLPQSVAGVGYTDAQTLFFTGKAAMYPGGSFELGFFEAQNPKLQMGVFQAPPAPGAKLPTSVTPGYADASFGVNAKSAHQKQALELVKWMATKKFGQLYTDTVKQISPVPGVSPKDPLLGEMLANYRANPEPYLMLIDFRYGDPSGTDLLGNQLQRMLLGQTDASGAAASTTKGLSAWFRPSGS